MIPAENRSDFVPYVLPFKISGATYPGVPHFLYTNALSKTLSDKPKSIILSYLDFNSLKIKFSGFKSL